MSIDQMANDIEVASAKEIQLSEAQKAKLKTIAQSWLKDAAQKDIVLVGGVQVERHDGRLFAVARPNAIPLQTWKEPLD